MQQGLRAGAVKQDAAEGSIDAITEVVDEALLAAGLFPWGSREGLRGHGPTGRLVPHGPQPHGPSEPGCSMGISSLAVMLAARVKAEVT